VTSFALWVVGLGGRATSLLLTTANLVVLARALGPIGRGHYFLFVTIVLVFAAIADLGISQSATVHAGRKSPLRQLHWALLSLAPASSVVVVLVGWLVITGVSGTLLVGMPSELAYAALALFPLGVYANYWTGMMIGARRIVEVNAVQLAVAVLSLVANALFVATSGDLMAAVLVYALVLVVQAVTMFAVAMRIARDGLGTLEARGKVARAMIGFGIRAYPSTLSALMWARSAPFVLNAFHGPAAVGVYSVAQQFAERTLTPIQSIQDVIYARIGALERPEATAVLNRFLRVTVAAVLPATLILLLSSAAIVHLLFADAFEGAAVALRLLLIGSAVQSIPVILATYFLVQLRRPGLLSLYAWANVVLNLLLLLTLVPAGAEVGAATAMLITQATGTALILRLYLRAARTDLASVLLLRRGDVTLVRQQALRLIRR
jgi:O-antigen/teichoic acid export membrane protein